MNDEGFREIQLNGKQLVFLFMAATVVSVVIFLCGVLVGRGVRSEGAADMTVTEIAPDADRRAAADNPGPAASASARAPAGAGGAAAPPEELSYAERLLRDTAPEEKLKEARVPAPAPAPPPPPAPAVQEPVAAQPRPTRTQPATAAPAPVASSTASDPSGPGFAVQVMIFDSRREADVLATQLISKGYPAFVIDPGKGVARAIYRVRVGKYRNRKDAEEISARLEKHEQFKPWIAR